MPFAGQSASAAANASASASSAAATSRVRADEIRDQLAVAAARDVFGASRAASSDHALIGQIGRTSIVPIVAPGQRAAHDSAASRSGTSIMK